ncbi:MAG: hypothetical protein CVT63_02240 [Candidatus Anoxymicrobium japonicum]|uniref:GGDEF domain-containing protein n=1 Tax=Candidatus Anoxymicrobium japonicum TaxID=2013648 RepID=A0A2N3G717_9ACTN|nr:MAG: hypothetical protein CVT63_02240 [Candidatus Anoxymicrobium japonicum]
MKYSRFEIITMTVGFCAVIGTIVATLSSSNKIADMVGQAMIIVVLFGGLHYGRKGVAISFVAATAFYAFFAFGWRGSIDAGTAAQIFIFRTIVFGVVGVAAGELHVRLKYLFTKLEHHDYVDNITSLYNAKYLAMLIEKYISESDRYSSKFCLASFTINEKILAPFKRKARVKIIRDLGNSVIRGSIRGSDEAARPEKASFTVLFPNTNHDGATCASNRVEKKIMEFLDHHGFDTDSKGVLKIDVLEYPGDKDAIELLADSLLKK